MKIAADCCSNPQTVLVEVLEEEFSAKLTINRCTTCQTYWRVSVDHVRNWDGEISEAEWYQPLTVNQAEAILADAIAN